MEPLKEILPVLLSGSLMLIVVSLGLTATETGATYLFKIPYLMWSQKRAAAGRPAVVEG